MILCKYMKIPKDKLDKLVEFYKLRQSYKKAEKELYELFNKDDIGSYHFNKMTVRIDIVKNWSNAYSEKDRAVLNKLYEKIRKGIKPKETLYVAYYKKPDDN